MINQNRVKYIDEEERDLDEALNSIDIRKQPTPDAKVQKVFKDAALHFVKQEAKMNIRISPIELDEIKKQAAIEGLKYQSFVKSILHKYITGQLTEIKAG
jgi:predicted DNA binding CopG/RHH family protein